MPKPKKVELDTELLTRYADAVRRAKEADEEKKALGVEVTSMLQRANIDTYRHADLGTFSIASKTSWQFSPAVASLEEQVKALKEREKEDGTAKEKDPTYYITLR